MKINNLNCLSCGGLIHNELVECEYCGARTLFSNQLEEEDLVRLRWMLKLLDARIWRESFSYLFKSILRFMLGLIFAFIVFINLFYYITQSEIISFLLLVVCATPAYLGFHVNYKSWLDIESKQKVYNKRIRPVLDEFMSGYNYYPGDLERVAYSLEKNELLYIKKFIIPLPVDIEMKDNLSRVLLHLEGKIRNGIYSSSQKKEGIFWTYYGFALSLAAVPLFVFQVPLWIPSVFLVVTFIFMILELSGKTSYVFHWFGYSASKKFLEKEIFPLLENYSRETGISLESIHAKSKEKNEFYDIEKVLQKKVFSSS